MPEKSREVVGTCTSCKERVQERHALHFYGQLFHCRCWKYDFPMPGMIIPDTIITLHPHTQDTYHYYHSTLDYGVCEIKIPRTLSEHDVEDLSTLWDIIESQMRRRAVAGLLKPAEVNP